MVFFHNHVYGEKLSYGRPNASHRRAILALFIFLVFLTNT